MIAEKCVPLTGGQGATQVARKITQGAPGCHGLAEHLATVGERSVGRFKCLTVFNSSCYGKRIWRRHAGDGAFTDPGEKVAFKSAQDAIPMMLSPDRLVLGILFSRDDLDADGCEFVHGHLLGIALVAGVDVVRQ